MMDEIKAAVTKEAAEELARAIKTHGRFHSDHEGVAVLEEEIREAIEDVNTIIRNFKSLKNCVFRDINDAEYDYLINRICDYAILGACELIQVAAMTAKFRLPWEGEEE